MSNIVQLPMELQMGDLKINFNAAAVKGKSGLLLIDCGLPGFLPKLEQAMADNGLSLSDVKKIIITHHDADHMGALKALLDKYPDIEVLCSPDQAPYVTGKEKPLRLAIFEKRYEASTDEAEKKSLEDEIRGLKGLETIESVTVINDGSRLPDYDATVIEVSGHMPGHVCVYINREKTLVSGDALISRDGRLLPPDSRFTLDMPTAIKSLEKLDDYDISTVICYHGGLVTDRVKESLESICRGE